MLYRFTLISDEVEDFFREIVIAADATFLDFNKSILSACNYPDDQMTSFYICDEEWEKQVEVTREDMGTGPTDEDIYVMADTKLRDLVDEDKQHLKFIFDPFDERFFYIQLKEIILKQDSKEPICTRSEGQAPLQLLQSDPLLTKKSTKDDSAFDLGGSDDFLNGEGFDSEDIDLEGFEISDGNPFE